MEDTHYIRVCNVECFNFNLKKCCFLRDKSNPADYWIEEGHKLRKKQENDMNDPIYGYFFRQAYQIRNR